MALTDKEIQALKPREKRYKVTDGDGLYLLVNPAGGKYWYMKYYLGGRSQEVVFGAYPAVSLKLAREKRQDARQQLARGLNPRLEKKRMRGAGTVMFEGIAEEWLRMMSTPFKNENAASQAALDPATTKKHRWIIETYLNPKLGKWPLALNRDSF